MDFYPICKELFSLNIQSVMSLDKPKEKWNVAENAILYRMVEGLLSLLLATRKNPTIRYHCYSEICNNLAHALQVSLC